MIGTNETYATIASALFDENKRQQSEVAGLLKRLESSVAAFEDTGRRLPHSIGAAVEARIESAAQQAATTIARNLTGAAAHAERAAAMYRREADIGPRKFLASSLIAIGLGLAALVWTARLFLPDAGELVRLRADVATLEETVRQLERKGGRARLAKCRDLKQRERLCVQVDESVKYENGYRIIKGY